MFTNGIRAGAFTALFILVTIVVIVALSVAGYVFYNIYRIGTRTSVINDIDIPNLKVLFGVEELSASLSIEEVYTFGGIDGSDYCYVVHVDPQDCERLVSRPGMKKISDERNMRMKKGYDYDKYLSENFGVDTRKIPLVYFLDYIEIGATAERMEEGYVVVDKSRPSLTKLYIILVNTDFYSR